MSQSQLLKTLENSKIIVSAGTGGVGKTTVSAALGALMARRGKKVLVLTIDPARRLAQALGLKDQMFEAHKVEGCGEFYASMIDAKRIFDRFVEKFSPRQEVADRLKANRLYQQLVSALTGSQEFTSMDRLLTEIETEKYDLIILDTPPTQNAVDFLKAPQRVTGLFDERITKWFVQTGKPVGLLTKIVSRGTQTALSALERVTGSEFIRELSDFFEQMAYLQSSVRERSLRVEKRLKQSSTTFLIVASADQQKLKETEEFITTLKHNGLHLKSLLINRAYPEWLTAVPSRETGNEFFNHALGYYEEQKAQIQRFKEEHGLVSVFSLPEAQNPLNGIEDIVKLSKVLEEL